MRIANFILGTWLATTLGCAAYAGSDRYLCPSTPTDEAEGPDACGPHHCQERFCNPWPSEKSEHGFWDFLRWRLDRLTNGPSRADKEREAAALTPLPPDHPKRAASLTEPTADGSTTITWIGHATFLIRHRGLAILTDPHFTKRASPVGWAGPKRLQPPGVALADLPPIDAVLLSHSHYDSLDLDTIQLLRQRTGGAQTTFFVPLGLKAWFEREGVSRVVAADWWQRFTLQRDQSSVQVTFVPAHHWSKRTLTDTRKSLWGGWTVQDPHLNLYFAGDSGMAPHFVDIGDRLGPFDVALIPIGAYEPRWFMKHHHINPAEAVQVHQLVRSRLSLAMHWGTFRLTDEPMTKPPVALANALNDANIDPAAFRVMRHGETLQLDRVSTNKVPS